MKGNYINALRPRSEKTGEDHPHMKGNYTRRSRFVSLVVEKIIPI